MQLSTHPEIWIGALLTLCIFSFLYRDNPFYKFAEHLFVGVSAAYWMVVGIHTTLVPELLGKLWPDIAKRWAPGVAGAPVEWNYLIPLLFGLLLLTRLLPKIHYLSRWAMALVIGYAAGTNLVRYLQSDLMSQISAAIKPAVVLSAGGIQTGATISGLVLFLGSFCGLVYFFFSREHKGVLKPASRIGIWILMVTFGASFGYTVMARISLLTGRMQYLFGDWLGIR